jgi:alkylation response protein AidB-like acyl-CoA dehydrogenase
MSAIPSLEEYLAEAKTWLEENLEPKDPREPMRVRGVGHSTPEDFLPARALQKKLFEAGYAGISWPVAYGGQGLPMEYQRAFGTMARSFRMPNLGVAGGTSLGACAQTMLKHASDEFLKRHIPKMLSGEELFVQLFSEPGAGSDLAGITTRAVKDGEQWVLTGSKIWTSGGYYADYGMCLARTDWDAPKHRGLTWFAVSLKADGVTVQPIREISGEAEFCQEFLDEVVVPDSDMIGELNQGWSVTQTMLLIERSSGRDDPSFLPPVDTGVDPKLVQLAEQAGRTKDPVARQLIGQIHVNDYVRVKLGDRISGLMRSGDKPAAGIASYWKLAAGVHDPIRARQIMELGQGVPLSWEPGDGAGERVAIEYLNSRVWSIAGGSNEMQRNSISEKVLGLPREPSYDSNKPFNEVLREAHSWTGSA